MLFRSNDTATTEIYTMVDTLSLHDALPIYHLRARITLVECDLRDLSSVRNLLEIAEPTHVVHLAAQSFVGASWKAPAETLTTNIISQVNLLEAMRGLKISPRFLAVGSSEEYGLVHPDELPIKETNPLPRSMLVDRKSTRLNSSHRPLSRMPSSA